MPNPTYEQLANFNRIPTPPSPPVLRPQPIGYGAGLPVSALLTRKVQAAPGIARRPAPLRPGFVRVRSRNVRA